jgi:hypothetical protein
MCTRATQQTVYKLSTGMLLGRPVLYYLKRITHTGTLFLSFHINDYFSTYQKIYKTKRLMLFREIITGFRKNH